MFGPEGLLYITIGDNASSSNAQNVLNYFGKVLRIDPGDPPGEPTYSVPESNPTFPEDINSAIYSIGLRNPYRASFGPNGELIVADVGEGTWEEVDVGRPTGDEHATTLWGANLGWPLCEGFCPSPPPQSGLTEPVFEYPHNGGSEETTGCAILGGYVVRDPRLTGLTGRYLYGDLCRTDLRTLDLGSPGGRPPAGRNLGCPGGTAARLRRRLARLRLRAVDRERLPGGTDAGRGDGLPASSTIAAIAADLRSGRRPDAARPEAQRPPPPAIAPGDHGHRHLRRGLHAVGDRLAADLEGESLCRLHPEQPSPRMSRGNQALEPRPRRARRPGEAAADAEEARLPARGGGAPQREEGQGAGQGARIGPERQLEAADGGDRPPLRRAARLGRADISPVRPVGD